MRRVALLLTAWVAAASAGEDIVLGEVGRRLDEAVRRTAGADFWGCVLAALDGEILLAKGYGFADRGKVPITPRSLFDIASVSKPLTATAVLLLETENRLRIDDPIRKHLPGVPEDKARLTIHHLLTHTAGLPALIPGLTADVSADRDRYVACLLRAPLEHAPGSAFSYSNHGYGLLAVLIERVAGMPFERYLKTHLFLPAGMEETGFLQDRDLAGRLLTDRRGGGDARSWPWDWSMRGAGGVVTSARDLFAFDRALRGGKLIPAVSLERAFRPALEGFGCGWMVGQLDAAGESLWVFHTGEIPGYRTYFMRGLAKDIVLVVLTDDRTDPRLLDGPIRAIIAP